MRVSRLLKVLRLVRLLKSAPLLRRLLNPQRCSSIAYLRDSVTLAMVEHTRKLRIARLIVLMLLVTHLMACLLGISAVFAEQKLDSWWGAHGYWYRREGSKHVDSRARALKDQRSSRCGASFPDDLYQKVLWKNILHIKRYVIR